MCLSQPLSLFRIMSHMPQCANLRADSLLRDSIKGTMAAMLVPLNTHRGFPTAIAKADAPPSCNPELPTAVATSKSSAEVPMAPMPPSVNPGLHAARMHLNILVTPNSVAPRVPADASPQGGCNLPIGAAPHLADPSPAMAATCPLVAIRGPPIIIAHHPAALNLSITAAAALGDPHAAPSEVDPSAESRSLPRAVQNRCPQEGALLRFHPLGAVLPAVPQEGLGAPPAQS